MALAACARSTGPLSEAVPSPASSAADGATEHDAEGNVAATPTPAPDAAAAQIDPDGDDDPIDVGSGPLPEGLRFERVGRAPLALQRICDLTPLGDALYASHAFQPLGTDGATITRYRPDDDK